MKLVGATEVQRLTGLSQYQLREWTVRRRIVEPDERPHGPGSRALFSWQTVLRLRLAFVLRESFHMELSTLQSQLNEMARLLSGVSFPALWGQAICITTTGHVLLEHANRIDISTEDCVILNLETHLQVLTASFDMDEPIRQRPLFSALAI